MEGKLFRVYKIILPSGNQYIGYTSLSLSERLRHHLKRAKSGAAANHPFYQELRNLTKEQCKIIELVCCKDRNSAMISEQEQIAMADHSVLLNISSGGVDDASFGGKVFWERIRSDPEKLCEYLQKLSKRKKENDWTNYEELASKALKWRKENPRLAYKMSYRAIRIATKAQGRSMHEKRNDEQLPLKERLLRKHKLGKVKSRYVKEVWRKRSQEEKDGVRKKISDTHKQKKASMTKEEKSIMTLKARESIDRKKQGAAASRGLKKFWEELRKDPQKYQKYIDSRKRKKGEGNGN